MVSTLVIVGETHINLSRDNIDLKLAVLVVNDLDVEASHLCHQTMFQFGLQNIRF